MKNAPIQTKKRSVLTGLNSNILTARKLFNSLRQSELMRVEASGHKAMAFPAKGEKRQFHIVHITPDEQILISAHSLRVAQIAFTFESQGFPIDEPYTFMETEVNGHFPGFEVNPYSMSDEALEALRDKSNRSREATHAEN